MSYDERGAFMEKDIRDEELAAMQAEGEEEVICVVLRYRTHGL